MIMHQPLTSFVLLVVSLLAVAEDQNHETYGAIGAEVVLKPPTETPLITDIEWQHGGNIAAHWNNINTTCYGRFEGRCELDPLSGALTIRELERSDSGIYTVMINNRKITDTVIQLYVIAPVTKPTVSQICNTEMTFCNLTCNVQTQEEDHITYRWSADRTIGPENKMFLITKEVEEVWLRCSAVNRVSDEIFSDPVRNPFKHDNKTYGAIGAEVVLKPTNETPGITDIEWQHEGNIAAYWNNINTTCYGRFKGRCELDPLSGALTIRELERSDSGVYTVMINNRQITDTVIQLYAIAPVTKPTVSQICNTEMTSCNLTCNVQTQEEDHITYRWSADNTIGPENKMFIITKEVEEERFRCSAVNRVSDEIFSDPVRNPFKQDLKHLWIFLGILITLLLIAVVLIVRYVLKKGPFKDRRCFGVPSVHRPGSAKAEVGTPEERKILNAPNHEDNPVHAVAAEVDGNNEAVNLEDQNGHAGLQNGNVLAEVKVINETGNPAEELSCREELKEGLPVVVNGTRGKTFGRTEAESAF